MRLLQLAATLQSSEELPRVRDNVLDAAGCDPVHLDRELRRLGPGLAEAYSGFALAPLTVLDADGAIHAAVLDYGAAAPLVQSMFAFLGEIDAGMVASRCADFMAWDRAVAAPLAAWSCRGPAVVSEEPPLRVLVHRAMSANRTALLSLASRLEGADDAAWHALGAVWGPALTVADHDGPAIAVGATTLSPGSEDGAAAVALCHAAEAFRALREAIHERRRALIAIAAVIDRVSAAEEPRCAAAMTLAVRVREFASVGSAVVAWLGDAVTLRGDHPVASEIQREGDRIRKFHDAVSASMRRTLRSIDRLVGMEH